MWTKGPDLTSPLITYGPNSHYLILITLYNSYKLSQYRKSNISLSYLFTFSPAPIPLLSFLTLLCSLFFMYMARCPYLMRVHFYPEIIYSFSVQFSLNELNLSYFLTSEIFEKISSLELLTTYHPENHKKFRLPQNSTEFCGSLDFMRRI